MTHKDFLFHVLDLLEKNRIPYWFMCGTLLGAVRDKDFLPGDHCDTDIAVKSEDGWKLRYILNAEHLKRNKLQWDYIRKGEVTVKDLEYKYKVDIFLMDKEDENYYIYSYKPSPITKKWDYEWRAKFPYKLFFPLRTIKFLGRKVYVPKKYKEVLEIHYGKEWVTPNPKWISSEPLNEDKEYKGFYPAGVSHKDIPLENKEYDFAYICVNLLRKKTTINCIESLKKHYPNVKIYVADQDAPSGDMLQFYEKMGVEYYYLPFDCGLSYARNFLIDKIKEPYIMWGDNDFIFDENNNIESALELVKTDKEIGVVGGSVLKNGNMCHYERLLMYDKERKTLIYIPLELTNPQKHLFKEHPYYYCDLTFNYAIAKKEVFDNKKVRWNEKVKVRYEHSDFFLKLRLFSKYKTVYFPDMTVHHIHVGCPEYQHLRNRATDAIGFSEFWDLKMNFTVTLKDREIYLESAKPVTNSPSVEKIVKVPIKPTNNFLNVFTKKEEPVKNLIDMSNVLNYLNINNIDYWLLKESCYLCIVKKTLRMETLIIGVPNKEMQERTNHLGIGSPYECIIEPNRATKQINLNNIDIKVPYPVIQYLMKYTNKSLNALKKEIQNG